MLTIMIIFTLLVALWGHAHAFAAARERRAGRRRHGSDLDSAPAHPASSIATNGH